MCLYAYREGSLLPTTGSLLSSCTRTLAVFQYSKPETLERKARPSNPVARPTDQPTNLPPLPPTLSGQCTPNRHIWTKSNRILSKRFSRRAPPSPFPLSFHRRSEAICTPFFNEGRPSPPTPRLLSMEKWKPFLRFPGFPLSLYLSYSLFFGKEEGRIDFFLGFVSRREEERERKRVW